jgi:hypothetical protein
MYVGQQRGFRTRLIENNAVHQQFASEAASDSCEAVCVRPLAALLVREYLQQIPLMIGLALRLHLKEMIRRTSVDDTLDHEVVMVVAVHAVDTIALKDFEGCKRCGLELHVKARDRIAPHVFPRRNHFYGFHLSPVSQSFFFAPTPF